jgi:hypothetical protein
VPHAAVRGTGRHQVEDLRGQARGNLQTDIPIVQGGRERITDGELLAFGAQIEALGGTVYADGDSEVFASSEAEVFGQGSTKVTGTDNARVNLDQDAIGEISGQAEATISGNARVVARGKARVFAAGRGVVELFDEAVGVGRDEATFVLHDRSAVYGQDAVAAYGMDNSHMILRGNARGFSFGEATWEVTEQATVVPGEEADVPSVSQPR